ncbi:MAG TPA: PASTA domain-containing protein [Nitrospirae bacterium]|nr:PASTA domain-containing protein [Nitrospirota bacterium]
MRSLIRIGLYVLSFFLLTMISGYVTFRVMGAGKTVTVPDLKGKNLVEANRVILEKRLYLKVQAEEFSTDVPAGHIILQNIPPGKKIKEGRTLEVVVSKGPKRYYMPNFVGMLVDEARESAIQKNIKIERIIKVHNDRFVTDMVIAQKPNAEEKGSDKVTLVVSAGKFRVPYVCPDFTTMGLDEAKSLADRLGLELELTGFGGIISSQIPRPGKIVFRGDVVRLELKYKEEQDLKWL